ncbi:hypothetical protein BDN70DRAFT_924979 [Pholiota conissans]|uniref:F-box domain-containing protein n=1 Tax=Pholiota conissans TaxID=109636 RepID=A0A9P6CNR7_9AGAR|nr:hypothetical protein BDN70DRAFT_924979 [Pholiota conissans]
MASRSYVCDSCHYCNYFGKKEYLCNPTHIDACLPCLKLFELEEKIKETRKMLVELANERQQLKIRANHNHDRIIHHLPLDVAGEIFMQCMPEDVESICLDNASRYTLSAPFVLSAVCKQWRTMAHSTPQLWKALPLCGGEDSEDQEYPPFPAAAVVENWIERAGNYPLSINLCVLHGTSDSINIAFPEIKEPTLLMKIIGILNRHSDRWVHLKYKGPSYLLSYMPDDTYVLAQLRQLHIWVSRGFTEHSVRQHNPCPTTLDLRPVGLKTLSIMHLAVEMDNLKLQHLTELVLGTTSLSECFEALQNCPNITRCTFRRPARRSYHHIAPSSTIVHHNLQYLEITGSFLYREVIRYLSCPSLKTLAVSPSIMPGGMPLITEFLERSRCSLESFYFKKVTLSDADIDLLCQAMPTLQHLHVELFNALSTQTARNLFKRLAEFLSVDEGKEPRYLPFLRKFILGEDCQDDVSHWKLLPEIFGTLSPTPGSYLVEQHRHMLEFVSVSVSSNLAQKPKSQIYETLGRDTLERILNLEDDDIGWQLTYGGDGEDIIDGAMEWYREKDLKKNVE